jgi:hypothetical protein
MRRPPFPLWIFFTLLAVGGFLVYWTTYQNATKTRGITVLKEGTFTLSEGQPLFVGDSVPRTASSFVGYEEQIEYRIVVKVTAGDAVQVKATCPVIPSDVSGDAARFAEQLSTTTPVKEITLTSRIKKSHAGETVLNLNLTTVGKSSDASVKITKEPRLYETATGVLH